MSARAVISPHAGYVYSGFTANAAYRLIDTAKIKRVVVIGPSHRVYINGASVALYDTYSSPCGELTIDKGYSQRLIESYEALSFEPSAHAEHSTEVQVPFIQHYFGDIFVVEIVYGDIDYTELVPIIEHVLSDEENFVVISTDLSHFYTLEDANKLDRICLTAVEQMDLPKLNSGCEACGMIGVKAMLASASKLGLQSQLIDYRTSYDASSDATRVVGYMSALIF
jgi:AmmeMemoRadiSam system protein B